MTQYSQDYALAELAALATAVTGGSLKLGQGDPSIISDTTTNAQYAAQEADFDGYAAIVLGAPLTPYQDGPNKYSMQVATVQFNYVDGVPHKANVITFAWIVNAAGNVIQAFTLPSPGVSMATNLDSLPIDLKFSRFTVPS